MAISRTVLPCCAPNPPDSTAPSQLQDKPYIYKTCVVSQYYITETTFLTDHVTGMDCTYDLYLEYFGRWLEGSGSGTNLQRLGEV